MFYDNRNILKSLCVTVLMFPKFSKNFRYVWRVFHFSLWSSRPSQLPAEILHVYFLYAYDLSIVIRNGKIVWKHGTYSLFFRSNLEYPGWPYREYIRKAKNSGFCEKLLGEKDFEAVLATLCCYDYAADVSEAVQTIATDQKDNHKCSSCVVVCWIAKIYNFKQNQKHKPKATFLRWGHLFWISSCRSLD